jgi:HEPN domain-containing protein
MNRDDFHRLAEIRVQEARALLDAGHYPGAYYIIGYAIECALKACVSKQVKQYDFPDKRLANEAFTHDLERLVGIAGLALDFRSDRQENKDLDNNWKVVKDWKETSRYDVGITKQQAIDLYSACTGHNGVLLWIAKQW